MEADDNSQTGATRRAARRRERSDQLKLAGFDPGIPYYWIEDHDLDLIRLSTFKDALFGSSYWEPKTVSLIYRSADPTDETRLPVVPELIEARYQPHIVSQDPDEQPHGCRESPDWYIRGHLWQSGLGPQQARVTMHLYVVVDGNQADEIQTIYLQLVVAPSGADPMTELVEGIGSPRPR